MAEKTPTITCLEDWDGYAPFQRRLAFWKRYWSLLAIVPFVAALIGVLHFFPNSSSKVLLVLVGATMLWAAAVMGYMLYLTLRGVDCPKCGTRFGRGAACAGCGLRRSAAKVSAKKSKRR